MDTPTPEEWVALLDGLTTAQLKEFFWQLQGSDAALRAGYYVTPRSFVQMKLDQARRRRKQTAAERQRLADMKAMRRDGITTFVEVGPGRVLTGLIKRIAPDAEALAVEDASTPDRLAVPDLSALTRA